MFFFFNLKGRPFQEVSESESENDDMPKSSDEDKNDEINKFDYEINEDTSLL